MPSPHGPSPRGSPQPGHHATRRERARTHLAESTSSIADEALTYAFERSDFYIGIADKLLEQQRWLNRERRAGHALCHELNQLAKALTPATYVAPLQRSVRDSLYANGAHEFVAETVAGAAGFAAKSALGMVVPTHHLVVTLRVLVPLVCPDFARCPAENDVTKAFCAPLLGEQLQAAAEPPEPKANQPAPPRA